jgi:hypothetical protein
MRSVSLGFALVAVALSPPGCRNPFWDESVILAVTRLDAPAAVVPGTAVTVILTVGVNGCERFNAIGQMRLNSQIVLTAVGTNSSLGKKNVACPAVYREDQHSVVIEQPPPAPFTILVREPRGAAPLQAEIAVGVVMD